MAKSHIRACVPAKAQPGHDPAQEHEGQTEEFTRLLIEFYERFSSWEQAVVRETGITLQQMHTLEILGEGVVRRYDGPDRRDAQLAFLATMLAEAGIEP